jgi:hypothetical protein
MDVMTMSDMGNEAMIPATLAKIARMGLVPKHNIAIENPRRKAVTPTLSADHRRITRRYKATRIGSKIRNVPSKGFAATN